MYVASLTAFTFVGILHKFSRVPQNYLSSCSLGVPTRVYCVLLGFIKMLHMPLGSSRGSFKVILMVAALNAEE